jgi:hypothetical protein
LRAYVYINVCALWVPPLCSIIFLKNHSHVHVNRQSTDQRGRQQVSTQKQGIAARPVLSAPANSTFLSEQTTHQQPANNTFLSQVTTNQHQPPAKRNTLAACPRQASSRELIKGVNESVWLTSARLISVCFSLFSLTRAYLSLFQLILSYTK